jgi:hypothetical protein
MKPQTQDRSVTEYQRTKKNVDKEEENTSPRSYEIRQEAEQYSHVWNGKRVLNDEQGVMGDSQNHA